MEHSSSSPGCDRRTLLRAAAGVPLALAASRLAAGEQSVETALPRMQIGRHSITRLVCGNNPFSAGSHLSNLVNEEMRRYFTPEQVMRTLRRCEEVGMDTWQSTPAWLEVYRRHRDAGGKMKLLAIETHQPATIGRLAKGGCIGMAHHGETTDRFFREGRLERVHDCLKRVRDAGMLAGVSTHIPDVIDAIESKGWDLDYYMTCVYQRGRSEAELQKLLGHVPVPPGEVYLKSDPPRMFQAMQATKRPCLAFKILAAGRLADRREWVEQAFRETFAAIKPADGVIIGIYDRYHDQAGEDAALARRWGKVDRR